MLVWRSVIGAGVALPRDAGRRPPPGELASAPLSRTILPLRDTHRVGSHPNCWGLRSRAPLGARCRPPPGELARGQRSKPFPRFFAGSDTPSRPAALRCDRIVNR